MSAILSEIDFVTLQSVDPTFIIELPYATLNNFTHTLIYDSHTKAYLRRPVAEALARGQQQFKTYQLGLKIWDAYRPFHIQQLLWQHCPDERYVMKPIEENGQMVAGSAHNRGCAVDLTLVDLQTGLEVEMPSLFDDFSRAAHRDYMECSVKAIQNRKLLEDVMTACGFIGLPTEWWHFTWHAAEEYPLCDLPPV